MEKRKLDADKKLINILFNLEPLDWCRRDNGELVVINEAGQKFIYTPDELNRLSDKVLEKKEKPPKSKPEPKSGLNPNLITDPEEIEATP